MATHLKANKEFDPSSTGGVAGDKETRITRSSRSS